MNLIHKDARYADINFDMSATGTLSTVKAVYVADATHTAFLDPATHPMLTAKGEASKAPTIFVQGERWGNILAVKDLYESVQTNAFYPYAVFSGVARVVSNELDKRAGKEAPKKTPEELEENKALKEAKEAWKQAISGGIANCENPKYYTKEAHLVSPAATYYGGKKGAALGEMAAFGSLSNEELITIVGACRALLGDASEKAKDAGFTHEVTVPTPDGFRELEIVKANTRHEERFSAHKGFYLDDAAYKKQMEWIESQGFESGWNIPQETVETEKIGDLTAEAAGALDVFNQAFCLSAINNSQLFVAPED